MNYHPLSNYHNGETAFFYTLDKCFISDTIKTNTIWEPYLHGIFEKYVNSNSIVIECGCHIGTHTVKLAKLCKKIYGFEPMPNTNKVLNMNIGINKITNATILNFGVSSEPGKTSFLWVSDGNPGSAGLDNNPMGKPAFSKKIEEKIDVSLTTIDSLNLEKVDFIKIDVEGYESLVIKGAMETIKRCKPVITMEVWKDHHGNTDIEYTKNQFKSLLDIGYNVFQIHGPDYLFIPIDLLLRLLITK
jgi:FkbM family methyltransferase